jgi:hypothetical protein
MYGFSGTVMAGATISQFIAGEEPVAADVEGLLRFVEGELERMLAMLLRLKDLRQGASAG